MSLIDFQQTMMGSRSHVIEDLGREVARATKYRFRPSADLPALPNEEEFLSKLVGRRDLLELPADNCLFFTMDGVYLHAIKDEGDIRCTYIAFDPDSGTRGRGYWYMPTQTLISMRGPEPEFRPINYRTNKRYWRQKIEGVPRPALDMAHTVAWLVMIMSELKSEDTSLVPDTDPIPEYLTGFEHDFLDVVSFFRVERPHYARLHSMEELVAATGLSEEELEVKLKDVPFVAVNY